MSSRKYEQLTSGNPDGRMWLWQMMSGTQSMQEAGYYVRGRSDIDPIDNYKDKYRYKNLNVHLQRLEKCRESLARLAGSDVVVMPRHTGENSVPGLVLEGQIESFNLAQGSFELLAANGLRTVRYCQPRTGDLEDQILVVEPAIHLLTDTKYDTPVAIPSLRAERPQKPDLKVVPDLAEYIDESLALNK